MSTADQARERLEALQAEIARHGFFSVLWREGDTWEFLASTDAHWLDKRMLELPAPSTAALHWQPAMMPKEEARG